MVKKSKESNDFVPLYASGIEVNGLLVCPCGKPEYLGQNRPPTGWHYCREFGSLHEGPDPDEK